MFDKIMPAFFVNVISFFIFFIGAPYWAGQEMTELLPSPIYKWVYMRITGIGHALYRIVESIVSRISAHFEMVSSWLPSVLNIAIYSLIVLLGSYAFTDATQALLPDTIDYGDVEIGDSSLDYWNEAVFVVAIFKTIAHADYSNWFSMFIAGFGYTLLFVFLYMLYYGILYGFLEFKVSGLSILRPLDSITESVEDMAEAAGEEAEIAAEDSMIMGIISLVKAAFFRLVQAACEFFTRIRILDACRTPISCLIFSAVIFGYTVFKVLVLKEVSDESFLMALIDESDLYNVLFSFGLGLLQLLFIFIVGQPIYSFLPDGVKVQITGFGEWCKESNERTQEKRETFAENYDYTYNNFRTGNETGPFNRMEL